MNMASHRILLLDAADLVPGEPGGNRFSQLAALLVGTGFDVTLATVRADQAAEPQPTTCPGGLKQIDIHPAPFPLVCGRGRARETVALRRAYSVAHRLADKSFDAVLAPLRGGLAHGLLMRRATEPAANRPMIALWCDAPTRSTVLDEDSGPADVAPLVADALERATLRLADLLLGPHGCALDRVKALGELFPPFRQAVLPEFELPPGMARRADSASPIEEIVFVGPTDRANGVLTFMDAIERLGDAALARVMITFLGPLPRTSRGVGAELVGIRAQNWPFRFQVLNVTDKAKILEYVLVSGRLAVFAAENADDDRLLRSALKAGCPTIASCGYDATRPGVNVHNACAPQADAFATALRALEGQPITTTSTVEPSDWGRLFAEIVKAPRREPVEQRRKPSSVSVGILHRDRPAGLRRALQSISDTSGAVKTEVIVLDNASTQPPAPGQANQAAAEQPRFLLLDSPVKLQQAANNRLAAEATGDIVIFLDDDNTFADKGIERLLQAFESGWFDIVVSTLDLVDGDPASAPSSGRFIFLGDAAMSGLFFNGFGDMAMAVRRDAFLRIGGFTDPGHWSAAPDWVFLAKARAAGLRIGVLLEPAIRYARRLDAHHSHWRKNDAEGARRAVAEAYGKTLDAPLLARFAQGLHLAGP